jgi:hypothetical protein
MPPGSLASGVPGRPIRPSWVGERVPQGAGVHRDIPTAMHKIIGNLFTAIDGVVESPEKWSLSYWNNDIANVVMGGTFDNGVIHQLYRLAS